MVTKPKPGKVVIDQGSKTDVSLNEAAQEIGRLQEVAKKATSTRVTLTWVIEGDKSE